MKRPNLSQSRGSGVFHSKVTNKVPNAGSVFSFQSE